MLICGGIGILYVMYMHENHPSIYHKERQEKAKARPIFEKDGDRKLLADLSEFSNQSLLASFLYTDKVDAIKTDKKELAGQVIDDKIRRQVEVYHRDMAGRKEATLKNIKMKE